MIAHRAIVLLGGGLEFACQLAVRLSVVQLRRLSIDPRAGVYRRADQHSGATIGCTAWGWASRMHGPAVVGEQVPVYIGGSGGSASGAGSMSCPMPRGWAGSTRLPQWFGSGSGVTLRARQRACRSGWGSTKAERWQIIVDLPSLSRCQMDERQ